HSVGQAACDRDADRRITPHKTTDAADGRGSRKDNQIGDLAAVKRQLHNTKDINHIEENDGTRLHKTSIRKNKAQERKIEKAEKNRSIKKTQKREGNSTKECSNNKMNCNEHNGST